MLALPCEWEATQVERKKRERERRKKERKKERRKRKQSMKLGDGMGYRRCSSCLHSYSRFVLLDD
jgi:hypothetical protein